MNLARLARRHFGHHASRKMVAFIHGRHCSRFPLTASLSDAVETAWSYHSDAETIAKDFKAVAAYGDLDQYTRDWQPCRSPSRPSRNRWHNEAAHFADGW
jgi:hypothetical protein